jgi:hypothetical protein
MGLFIGEQLESLDKQRFRAQESKELVLHFLDFNQGNTARLDSIRNGSGWEGKSKASGLGVRYSVSSDCSVGSEYREAFGNLGKGGGLA